MKTRKLPWFDGLRLAAMVLLSTTALADEFYHNVVIVLDASGSMKNILPGTALDRMTAAKAAIKAVLQKVPQSTRIGLLVFSAREANNDWVYPLGPRRDTELMRALDAIEPAHDTPLGRYIKKGADRLLEERTKQYGYGTYRLLIVTDGEAQDQNLVDKYTPDVISRGITVDVIGVGMRTDHTLATKVHSYRRANDPAALNRAVADVFAEVSGPGKGVATAETFEMLASIPNEVASAMIQALSNSGNQPIGEKPKPTAPPASRSIPAAASKSASASIPTAVPAPAPPPAPASSPPAVQSRRSFPGVLFLMILVGVIVLRKLVKGSRR